MNWKTFVAMLARDAHVARRNFVTTLLQTLVQPMLFTFIFGRVMTTSGYLPMMYKSLLLPGIMALSMIMAGTWSNFSSRARSKTGCWRPWRSSGWPSKK